VLPYARMRAQTIHGGVRELHGRARELATFLPSGPRRSYNPNGFLPASEPSRSKPGAAFVEERAMFEQRRSAFLSESTINDK
jgi:hypothetical protein